MKLHDAVDVAHDLDNKRPDGPAQINKQCLNICQALTWKKNKERSTYFFEKPNVFFKTSSGCPYSDYNYSFKCIFSSSQFQSQFHHCRCLHIPENAAT